MNVMFVVKADSLFPFNRKIKKKTLLPLLVSQLFDTLQKIDDLIK